MKEDDLHALFLLALLPLAAALLWFAGRKPSSGIRGFLAFLLVFAVSAGWGPAYAFGPKVIAIKQVLIPALVAMICAAYMKHSAARWVSNIALLLISMSLSGHFISMVAGNTERCEYTGHTDKFVSYRCNKPAEPYALWHTWFTGIHGLRTVAAAPAVAVSAAANLTPGNTFRDCDVCPEMVAIPAGSFMMGSPASEQGRSDDEGPQHQVNIARPFAAGKFEVTFDEWEACVRERGCRGGRGRGKRPVFNVSWNDAKQYTKWLSAKTGKPYRLLTEAEWEYVARAGTTTPFNTGANINPTRANYDAGMSYAGSVIGEFRKQTAAAGSFQPNAFGLYDVHGNVWEWTEDCWNANYQGAPNDGSARTTGDCGQRVLRGGSWGNHPRDLRSAIRVGDAIAGHYDDRGLRVARTE